MPGASARGRIEIASETMCEDVVKMFLLLKSMCEDVVVVIVLENCILVI